MCRTVTCIEFAGSGRQYSTSLYDKRVDNIGQLAEVVDEEIVGLGIRNNGPQHRLVHLHKQRVDDCELYTVDTKSHSLALGTKITLVSISSINVVFQNVKQRIMCCLK